MRRLAWVAGFCIGPFGGNERPWKPFNPILGETFELDLPENGVRFLAEQVPRQSAHQCVTHILVDSQSNLKLLKWSQETWSACAGQPSSTCERRACRERQVGV